jgi:hypothetical protein
MCRPASASVGAMEECMDVIAEEHHPSDEQEDRDAHPQNHREPTSLPFHGASSREQHFSAAGPSCRGRRGEESGERRRVLRESAFWRSVNGRSILRGIAPPALNSSTSRKLRRRVGASLSLAYAGFVERREAFATAKSHLHPQSPRREGRASHGGRRNGELFWRNLPPHAPLALGAEDLVGVRLRHAVWRRSARRHLRGRDHGEDTRRASEAVRLVGGAMSAMSRDFKI